MARPRRSDTELTRQAVALAATAKDMETLRSAQAVLLPALLNATLEQTAAALGVGRATVHRLQQRLRCRCAHPESPHPIRGGRHHATLSLEEERIFLEPWVKLAVTGGLLVVAPIRAALAQQLGRPVAASVVYRLLERHGWRKVAPDTRHPKSNPQIQEDWKKNCPKLWQP